VAQYAGVHIQQFIPYCLGSCQSFKFCDITRVPMLQAEDEK
jgi:hypothetical protein